MADLNDDDHLFEELSPESPGTIGRKIVRRLGLASQVTEAIRSPNNNTNGPITLKPYYPCPGLNGGLV